MAIIENFKVKPVIDLSSPDGNVFGLIGLVTKTFKLMKRDYKEVMSEMMGGDYYNAVFVVERELGEFYDIILPEGVAAQKIVDSRKAYEKSEKMKNVSQNPENLANAYLR